MDEKEIRALLQIIVENYPPPLYERHFNVSKEEEQQLRNNLLELKDRELIEAFVQISTMVETAGLPITVGKIKPTEKGRDFLAGKLNQPTAQNFTTTVNVTSHDRANPAVNIAPGGAINITNNADSEKLIELLLANINATDLPPEQREGLSNAVKNLFKQATPAVVAGLLVSAVTAMF